MDAPVMASRPEAVNARCSVLSGTTQRPRGGDSMAQEVALVTGASSGIGGALARRIARDGRDLVLVARRAERLEALARELGDAHGVGAHVIVKDLLRPGAPRELVEEVARRGLTVDWLVNNAGFGPAGRLDRLPVEGELAEIRLNVEVLVELTGRCLPAMVARKAGVVMNIASMGAFAPGPYMATYAATKAFVLSFSEGIAAELGGTGVQVLCVCPGFTRTEFQEKAAVDVSGVPGFAWMSAEQVADQAGKDGKTDWYRNLTKTPTAVVRQDGYSFRVRAVMVTDAQRVEAVHKLFTAKYTTAWLLSFLGSSIGQGRPVELVPVAVSVKR